MAESEERSERVPSAATGRHSHRRRARKRRAGESPGALSDGSLEQKVTRLMSVLIGFTLIVGQLVLTYVLLPTELVRTVIAVFGVILLALIVVWLDQQHSKKRNPKPRWMRGVLIAGFLCFSVVIGSLIVLNITANPLEDGTFTPAQGADFSTHFGAKTDQLKLLAFHIVMTVGGMAMLVLAMGPEKHRRPDHPRFKSAPSTHG